MRVVLQCIETYLSDVSNVVDELKTFQQRLHEFTAGDRVSTSTDPISFSKLTYDNNITLAQAIFHRGRSIINILR